MAVGTFNQPNFQSQSGNTYKANIDNSISVLGKVSQQFAVHENAPTSMGVTIDAGILWNGDVTFSNIAAAQINSITAPTTNPRKDLIVLNRTTGVATRIAGTEAASPVDPAVTAGNLPIARINLTVGMTAISNQKY